MLSRLRDLLPKPPGQRGDLPIRLGLEFSAHEHLVYTAVIERAGAVSGRGQRPHEVEGGPGTERVEGRRSAPPMDFRRVIPTRCCLMRGGFQGGDVPPGDPGPLGLHPLIELHHTWEMEPVEERALVATGGTRQVTPVEGVLQLPEIDTNRIPIESKRSGIGEDHCGGKIPT